MRKGLILLAALLVICGAIINYFYQDPLYFLRPEASVENIASETDKDEDGILDSDDIIEGARMEIANGTKYKSAYYDGGYPPENEGVCTDVVWRALRNAGYDLKVLMDEDIQANVDKYPNVNDAPDPNIDFRRVKNQMAFFKRHAESLTMDIIPYDVENLKQWQPGDIVVLKGNDHVAIISDNRRKDGVPYIIHNASTYVKEENSLMHWKIAGRIIGHYRYPKP